MLLDETDEFTSIGIANIEENDYDTYYKIYGQILDEILSASSYRILLLPLSAEQMQELAQCSNKKQISITWSDIADNYKSTIEIFFKNYTILTAPSFIFTEPILSQWIKLYDNYIVSFNQNNPYIFATQIGASITNDFISQYENSKPDDEKSTKDTFEYAKAA
jgi:hypothetical protein